MAAHLTNAGLNIASQVINEQQGKANEDTSQDTQQKNPVEIKRGTPEGIPLSLLP
jgi:hypothetical protein